MDDTAEGRANRAAKFFGAACIAALSLASNGCATYGHVEPRVPRSVDLRGVHIALESARGGICPREVVRVKVVDQEGAELPEAYLSLTSDEGTFDRFDYFTPDPDLAKTADRPFVIDAVVHADRAELRTTASFRPDYTCITYAGAPPRAGRTGADGALGATGAKGVDAADSDPPGRAGAGGNGAPGGRGQRGGDGAPGPRIVAYVTYVATPFYERLVAVRVTGDVDDYALFPEGAPVVIRAAGGDGGSGGHGGHGGWGGQGGAGRRRRSRASTGVGGDGGAGGDGGRGGDGGDVTVVLDDRYPDLEGRVIVDVRGGAGGDQGGGAIAGRSPITSVHAYRGRGRAYTPPNGEWPGLAAHGTNGDPGARGQDGTASIARGDVSSAFAPRGPVATR